MTESNVTYQQTRWSLADLMATGDNAAIDAQF